MNVSAVITTRLCRAPPHTIADVGRIGGGQVPMPSDVSLAHRGMRMLHVVSKDPWGQGVGVLGHAMIGSHDRELSSPLAARALSGEMTDPRAW
jgi:Magnesium chelatase, subunit ChlI